ncbi:hypothetical protein DWB61_16610 [Ancylomarina euxinus]|uniref:Uncharacterized protein n=1 Tax=Ancylomarina euxinus TaxID=2283627 RepID=A0A425XWX7_9BACT|nr:hypothetical protein [Ancylomarina euxinus]MCZ4696286.1 hypothetical protein [Ancylomarina euxinus]MUP16684.1 hypothetical protein [Ancylomarina euxinus]RRG19142.1 hypothetical protein DWB61_16610 [Ancylomarina euxinus]
MKTEPILEECYQLSKSTLLIYRVFLILTFFISALSLSAQEKVIVVGGTSAAPFSRGVSKTSKINEIAYQKQLLGSFYLDDDWAGTDIYLINDSLVLCDINTRIDLRNNVLEIKTKKDTLVLPTYRIKSLFFKETAMVFVTENIVKSPTSGFYQIIVDDKYSLLCQPKVKVERADFNIITNSGSRDDKIIQQEFFYLFVDENLIKLEKSKAKFKKQFRKNKKIEQFFSQKKVKPKNKAFLIELVKFINEEKLNI